MVFKKFLRDVVIYSPEPSARHVKPCNAADVRDAAASKFLGRFRRLLTMQRRRFFSASGLAGSGSITMLAAEAGQHHVQGSLGAFAGEEHRWKVDIRSGGLPLAKIAVAFVGQGWYFFRWLLGFEMGVDSAP
ncbi:MAG: hypothetical protein WA815_08565 [Terracidiphilus sp.]